MTCMDLGTTPTGCGRGPVYLMGRVIEREAGRADIGHGVGGVRKVVRVFDLLTEAELVELPPAANSAGAPATTRCGSGAC